MSITLQRCHSEEDSAKGTASGFLHVGSTTFGNFSSFKNGSLPKRLSTGWRGGPKASAWQRKEGSLCFKAFPAPPWTSCGHPVQQRKRAVRAPQGGVPDPPSAAHEGALADECTGLYRMRHPDLGPHLQGVRIYRRPAVSAAAPTRTICGCWSLTCPHECEGCAEPVFWFELGPEGYFLRHGLLAGSGRHHGQVPRPHGPGAQGHGKAGPPLPEAGRVFVPRGGSTSAPRPPSRLLTPWYSKKSSAFPRRPHGELPGPNDLVDLPC